MTRQQIQDVRVNLQLRTQVCCWLEACVVSLRMRILRATLGLGKQVDYPTRACFVAQPPRSTHATRELGKQVDYPTRACFVTQHPRSTRPTRELGKQAEYPTRACFVTQHPRSTHPTRGLPTTEWSSLREWLYSWLTPPCVSLRQRTPFPPWSRAWLVVLLTLLTSPVRAFDDPTFVIESERFNLYQQNDYTIGQFDRPLSESELLEILREGRYKLSKTYRLERGKHFYFAYLVENRTSQTQRIHLKLPGRLAHTKAYIVRDMQRLERMQDYPSHIDISYGDVPPGRTIMIGTRYGTGTLEGQAVGTSIKDGISLAEELHFEIFSQATIIGIVAIMVLYNIGMFLAFRRIYFFYYCVYSGATLYSFLCLWGWQSMNIPLQGLAIGLSGLGLLLFCDTSLGIIHKYPRLAMISHIFKALCIVLAIFGYIKAEWALILLTIPVVMLFCWYASFVVYRDGFKPALHFIIGWGLFFSTVFLGIFSTMWVTLPVNTIFIMAAAFVTEICFFSFAISQKARLAEQKALSENEHAFNQLKKVFYPHQITQIKAGIELEKTMPTGREMAYVISFDIVGSSRINHPNLKRFLESSVKRCLAVVSESYDEKTRVAKAYRIKEMGDGFLCSVGFPFPVAEGQHAATTAIELAYRFIEIFQACVDEWVDHQPVYGSIGIAYDALEGSFPLIGTMEYDVYGRSIVLATRYESFRKLMFPQGLRSHIICIHQKVFDSLPPDKQQDFTDFDLTLAHLAVRDDFAATHVYYRLISAEAAGQGLLKVG